MSLPVQRRVITTKSGPLPTPHNHLKLARLPIPPSAQCRPLPTVFRKKTTSRQAPFSSQYRFPFVQLSNRRNRLGRVTKPRIPRSQTLRRRRAAPRWRRGLDDRLELAARSRSRSARPYAARQRRLALRPHVQIRLRIDGPVTSVRLPVGQFHGTTRSSHEQCLSSGHVASCSSK